MASGSGEPYQSPTLLLLKDYLRDDLNSCSSSGFKSLNRRQGCLQPRSSSSSSSRSVKSALRKASEAVFNVIKSLPIPAKQRSSLLSQTEKKGGAYSRSRWSFWRRESKTPSSVNSNSWQESNFTCSLTTAVDSTMGASVTTTNTCCSITNSTRDWPNEEKEQFSPVSVLDCTLFDDDEEITSHFNSTSCSRLEGSKHKHMQKSQHFKRVASLKPVALEKKISISELHEDESICNHSTKPSPVLVSTVSSQKKNRSLCHDKVEENIHDLVKHVKNSIPSVCLRFEAEKLLFDFFKQSIGDNNDIENSMKIYLCKVAGDWIRGQPQKQYLSLKVNEGRQVYIKDMDKCGSWRNSDEEIQQLAMELEVEFSTGLVNELVLDLATC